MNRDSDSFEDSGDNLSERLHETEAAVANLHHISRNTESVLSSYKVLAQVYWGISLYESRWNIMSATEVAQLNWISDALNPAEEAVIRAAADVDVISGCENLLRDAAVQYLDVLDERDSWWCIHGTLGEHELVRELSLYLSGHGVLHGGHGRGPRPLLYTRPVELLVHSPVWVRELVVALAAYHQQWTIAAPPQMISTPATSLDDTEADYLVGLWRNSGDGRYRNFDAAVNAARRLAALSVHRSSSWTTPRAGTQSSA